MITKVYQSENDEEIEMEVLGILTYFGESSLHGLTNGKNYEVVGVEYGMLRVVDDEEEDYLYSATNPKSSSEAETTGTWKIVESFDEELTNLLNLKPLDNMG